MNKEFDLLECKIGKGIVVMAIPVLIGMFFELLYNAVDTFFISLIDKNATAYLSGGGLVFPLFFMVFALSQGVASGAGTLATIHLGERKKSEAEKTITVALWLGGGLSLIIVFLLYFFGDIILQLLSGSKISREALECANTYLQGILISIPFMFSSSIYFATMNAQGKTKYSGLGMILSNLLNLILDPIFIFTFKMGVFGAALATSLAHVMVLAFCIVISLRDRSLFPIRWKIRSNISEKLGKILAIGIPQSFSFLIISLSFIFMNYFVTSVGEAAMNAYTLVGRFYNFLITPVIAIAIGMSTLIGQNLGAGRYHRVKEAFITGTRYSLIISIFCSLALMSLGKSLFNSMSNLESVRTIAFYQNLSTALFVGIGSAFGVSAAFSFTAIGKPFQALLAHALRSILIAPPLCVLFFIIFGPDIRLVWAALSLGFLLGGIISYFMANIKINRLNSQSLTMNNVHS